MLKDRIITALVLLAVFFVTLISPSPVYFGLLTLLFVAVGAWEWGRLSGYLEGMRCALAATVVLICSILWCW
ncbi:MAG: phosphatidate cytidylyltransferase, partial [Saezia sp.]